MHGNSLTIAQTLRTAAAIPAPRHDPRRSLPRPRRSSMRTRSVSRAPTGGRNRGPAGPDLDRPRPRAALPRGWGRTACANRADAAGGARTHDPRVSRFRTGRCAGDPPVGRLPRSGYENTLSQAGRNGESGKSPRVIRDRSSHESKTARGSARSSSRIGPGGQSWLALASARIGSWRGWLPRLAHRGLHRVRLVL